MQNANTPETEAPTTTAPAFDDLYCPACNYHLRGVESDRCPECGLDIADVKQRKSLIPWVHRAEIGRVRAYWQTIWLVSFRSRRFIQEISRPAHEDDAKRFRRVTLPILFLPFVCIAIGAILILPASGRTTASDLITMWGLMLPGILACIAILTAAPVYALQSRRLNAELQHRAAVLCYYAASARPAWLIVTYCLVGAGMWMEHRNPMGLAGALIFLTGMVIALIVLCLTVLDVVRVVHQASKHSPTTWLISLKIFAFWLIGGALALFGIPLTMLLIVAVYYSLC